MMSNPLTKLLASLSLVFLVSLRGDAAIVADSVLEFSGVQGQNNWYYGYYSGSLTQSSFALLPTFGSASRPNTWVLDDDAPAPWYYTGVDSVGGHPNGINPVRNNDTQFAVRRWVAESTGSYTFEGNIADLDLGFGDNGIIGRIFANNTEIFSQNISAGDFAGVNYNFVFDATAGTAIDFVIDANGSDLFDSTRFTAIISSPQDLAIPEPSSLLLLASGCLFALRRTTRHANS